MASRDIKMAHPYLQERWPKLKARFEADHPGMKLIVVCTYRSPEEQWLLYQQGRLNPGKIVTMIDGKNKKGNHNYNPSHAFDVAVLANLDEDAELEMVTDAMVYKFHDYAADLQLEWGGDWQRFKDKPHFEIPDGVLT